MSCLTLRPRASCARVAICWHPTSLLSSSTPEIHFWSSSRCISPTMVYRRVHDGVGDMCVNDRIGDMVNYGTGDVGNCGTGDVWNCGVGDMGNCRVRDAGNYGVGDMAGKLWGRRYGREIMGSEIWQRRGPRHGKCGAYLREHRLSDRCDRHEHRAPHHRLRVVAQRPREIEERETLERGRGGG